jgi:hypothetical protein
MIALARSEPGITISSKVLDANPMLLGVQNGTLDLRTGELRAPQREDYLTKVAPVAFDPDAKCPLWLQTMNRSAESDDASVLSANGCITDWAGPTVARPDRNRLDTRNQSMLVIRLPDIR